MSADKETLAVYGTMADHYRTLVSNDGADASLLDFLDTLPDGARILDLGCGPGNAAAAMIARGYDVLAVDAAPEMVALARDVYGVPAQVQTFDDLEAVDAFDGVWANFSLLHAERAELPTHLAALHRALRPGGRLHLGMKTGRGAARDTLGRLYTYYSETELAALLVAARYTVVGTRTGITRGMAGTDDPFVIFAAKRDG
ncbi:MAG: methyltransferase domain-containing protein [Pseudomonadota bacterium]